MATWMSAWFRVDSGGFLDDFSMARNMTSVHGLVGRGPLHLSTIAWVPDERRSAASFTAFSSESALAESRAGTWISLPEDSTQVFHEPAVRSARVTGAMASPPSSPQATMPELTATQARPATATRQRRDRVAPPPDPITLVPPRFWTTPECRPRRVSVAYEERIYPRAAAA